MIGQRNRATDVTQVHCGRVQVESFAEIVAMKFGTVTGLSLISAPSSLVAS